MIGLITLISIILLPENLSAQVDCGKSKYNCGVAKEVNEPVHVTDAASFNLALKWEEFAPGAECAYLQARMFNSVQSISVIKYNMKLHPTEVVNDPAETADSTSAMALRHGGIAAINGSYFHVKELVPSTYTKDDGKVEGITAPQELFRVESVLALRDPNSVTMFLCDTVSYESRLASYKEAIAGGPMLLINGNPAVNSWGESSFFTGRHPRTFVGTVGDIAFLVVVDGRFPGQADGATIAELAQIALLFGCKDAINLDGGGSSVLWVKDKGVLSNPYDNHRFDHCGQRVVPNIIMIK